MSENVHEAAARRRKFAILKSGLGYSTHGSAVTFAAGPSNSAVTVNRRGVVRAQILRRRET
jgi:hypothetical protein